MAKRANRQNGEEPDVTPAAEPLEDPPGSVGASGC